MFPVGELFFPNWKPCFWGLLAFYIIFCHFPRSRPLKEGKNKSKKIWQYFGWNDAAQTL
jgi:hypothetical protein